jgi:hypothetical protein
VSEGSACDLPEGGVPADIGVSDVFPKTCPGFEHASLSAVRVLDARGPIQAMTFAVPANSRFNEISAQAAYFVFGFGAEGGVLDEDGKTPIWNDERYIFQRGGGSGTQALMGAAIGVPAERFRGAVHRSTDELATDLVLAGGMPTSADAAIGILAADYIDSGHLRAQIRPLAFQDAQQACAVYPDSSATARDKQNVRDGHYPLWGPLHFLYRVGDAESSDSASRQQVTDLVAYLTGTEPLPSGVSLMDVYAQSGLVPDCAMRVMRTQDGGNVVPYRPDSPCSCLFELKATGSTRCKPCETRRDCDSDQTCSLGYCEP